MNKIKPFFTFLGGVYFAIFLIICAICAVIFGTVMESQTDSHAYAVFYVYQHPLFIGLLGLFFLNIFVSSLRRWPFQKNHIPFLLTHLGLLLIIAGIMTKNFWGLQGYLLIWEGNSSREVFLPFTHALHFKTKNETSSYKQYPLQEIMQKWQGLDDEKNVQVKVLSYVPHVQKLYDTWIKNSKIDVLGLPAFPTHFWEPSQPLPSLENCLLHSKPWYLLGLQTEFCSQAAQQVYLENIILTIQSKNNFLPEFSISLEDALKTPFSFQGKEWKMTLNWEEKVLQMETLDDFDGQEKYILPVWEENNFFSTHIVSNHSFAVSLHALFPILLFTQEETGDIHIWSFNQRGQVHHILSSTSSPSTIIMYDQGWQGYTVQTKIPSIVSQKEEKYGLLADVLDPLDLPYVQQTLLLETPLHLRLIPFSPPIKIEDQQPGLLLEIKYPNLLQKIPLAYSSVSSSLGWPLLDGIHQVYFQPQTTFLPYRLYLQQARIISYPQALKTYSYEADMIIINENKEKQEAFTLSMNRVYETEDGYRFYLSQVTDKEGIKQVQITVNHDPFKYWLTYPGIICLVSGIFFLFWAKNKKTGF